MNLWARLGDGERAWERLARRVAENTSPNLCDPCYAGRPTPFEIDANAGRTSPAATAA